MVNRTKAKKVYKFTKVAAASKIWAIAKIKTKNCDTTISFSLKKFFIFSQIKITYGKKNFILETKKR